MADDGSREERQEELDHAVALKIRYGCRVEARSEYQAVVVEGRPVNHLLHFLVGCVTVGLWWLFVWLPLTLAGGERRIALTVDEHGRVDEVRSARR